MGSGTKRRQGDNVKIVPQKPRTVSGAKGGSSGGSQENQQGQICPLNFQANLSRLLILGSRLALKQNDGILIIESGFQEVGRLSRAMSKKIGDCILLGYHYEGIVKKDNEYQYAEFNRK